MRTVKREIVGGFIFSSDSHILLGKSLPGGVYQGYWMVPGGGIEPGESEQDAVIREVHEETGLDLNAIADISIEKINDDETDESEKTLRDTGETVIMRMHFNDFYVTVPQPASELNLTGGDDFMDPQWVPAAELPRLKIPESTKVTLRKLGYTV